jgi:hypothetical protein
MAIEISNMFKNCASLTKVEFPNLSTNGSIYSGCSGSGGSNKKQLVKTLQSWSKDIFELYCKLYPEHKSDWETLLKMNENDYRRTINSIIAAYDLDLPDID